MNDVIPIRQQCMRRIILLIMQITDKCINMLVHVASELRNEYIKKKNKKQIKLRKFLIRGLLIIQKSRLATEAKAEFTCSK